MPNKTFSMFVGLSDNNKEGGTTTTDGPELASSVKHKSAAMVRSDDALVAALSMLSPENERDKRCGINGGDSIVWCAFSKCPAAQHFVDVVALAFLFGFWDILRGTSMRAHFQIKGQASTTCHVILFTWRT
jgi:hypothetical protein